MTVNAWRLAEFVASGGAHLSDDPCLATRDCPFLRPFPAGDAP